VLLHVPIEDSTELDRFTAVLTSALLIKIHKVLFGASFVRYSRDQEIASRSGFVLGHTRNAAASWSRAPASNHTHLYPCFQLMFEIYFLEVSSFLAVLKEFVRMQLLSSCRIV